MSSPPSTVAYQFSEAEIRALSECSVESFYFRSFPLMTLFGTATYISIKKGMLRSHSRFGPLPKVFLACWIGYFLGKISYTSTCIAKMTSIPGSKLGDYLMRREMGIP